MSDLGKNPYRPGNNLPPTYLAGRDRALRDFGRTLDASPEIPANVRLTGLRGVGKSVLLRQFQSLAEDRGWVTARIELEPRHNDEESIAALIRSVTDEAIRRNSLVARVKDLATHAVRSVHWSAADGIDLYIDPASDPRLTSAATSLSEAVEVALKHGNTGFVLLLDEAQVLFDDHRDKRQQHPLSMLIAAVSALQSSGAPLALVLCGLPTLQANLLRARTYTERMFIGERVDSLDRDSAVDALLKPLADSPIIAEDDFINEVIEEVDGYPYFIQLWGAEMWEAARDANTHTFDSALLARTRADIYRRLDRDFYEGRLNTLTPAEQDLLLASGSASYPPLQVSDLRAHTSKNEKYVNVLVGRLVEAGVIYREAKGTYRYTAPQFHDFLQRHNARLAVPNRD